MKTTKGKSPIIPCDLGDCEHIECPVIVTHLDSFTQRFCSYKHAIGFLECRVLAQGDLREPIEPTSGDHFWHDHNEYRVVRTDRRAGEKVVNDRGVDAQGNARSIDCRRVYDGKKVSFSAAEVVAAMLEVGTK